jgi:hypothetical protein
MWLLKAELTLCCLFIPQICVPENFYCKYFLEFEQLKMFGWCLYVCIDV